VRCTKKLKINVALHNVAMHNASCAVQQAPKTIQLSTLDKKVRLMSVIEKSVQLGKDLFAINRKTTREIVAIQVGGVRRYIETNVDAVRNVRDIKSFPAFTEAQKSYNTALIKGVQSDLLAGRDVVKSAFEDTRAAINVARGGVTKKAAAKKTVRRKTTAKKTTTRKPRATAAKKAA